MADSITLLMPNGKASRTALDPANSGTIGSAAGVRRYVEGPPTDGQTNGIGRWEIRGYGTQTDTNSLTAATYQHVGDFANNTTSPTTFSYVACM